MAMSVHSHCLCLAGLILARFPHYVIAYDLLMAGQADSSTCIQVACIQVTFFFPLGVQSALKKANRNKFSERIEVHVGIESSQTNQTR